MSLATLSQSRKNSVACGSRKTNRALLGGRDRVGVDRGEQGAPEVVGGQDVPASAEDERGCAGHRVEDALHRGPDALLGRSAAWRTGRAGAAQQVEQVDPLGLVELQRLRDAVDDALGDAGGVAALQPGVVLAGDAREEGDLLAAQPGDPSAVSAVRRAVRPARG